jgi:hypothetical protein
MTDLIEFRKHQQTKKQLKQLTEQLDKQNTNLKQLEDLFKAHTHDDFLTKEALAAQSIRFATKEELRAVKTEIPKPYVHPATGVCPQKPKKHRHVRQDIINLKIPRPYDIEQLKKDHSKLREPHLHPPMTHSHDANEITGKIKPQQIERKGLDADTVDGKHAKELVKRIYAGGGPHTHPESEVNFDIENGHKHDGVLARQMSHSELAGITTDQHHAKLHASSHEKGGNDVLGVVVVLKFGAEGATTTSTVYVTIANSDIAFNPALFKLKATLYVKFIYHIKNDTAGQTTYMRVLRQNAGTTVDGSEASVVGAGWGIVETAWIDWSNESGNESYQVQMKVTGGMGEFNSALMVLSPIQL